MNIMRRPSSSARGNLYGFKVVVFFLFFFGKHYSLSKEQPFIVTYTPLMLGIDNGGIKPDYLLLFV